MPHQRPRQRWAARALSIGTTLSSVGSARSISGQVSTCPAAFLSNPLHQLKNYGGKCHCRTTFRSGLLSTKQKPTTAHQGFASMTASQRSASQRSGSGSRRVRRITSQWLGGMFVSQAPSGPGREYTAGGPLKAMSVLLHDEPITFGGRQPLLSYVVRWFIKRRIQARAKASAALNVEIEARSNREAMMGRFDTICVDFQELIFDDMQLTGGARFELLGVDLLTPGLLPGPMRRLRRLRRPCEVSCTAKFTDADLAYSPAIRRLAERVVNSALKTRRPRRAANRRRHWGVEEEDQELELETEPEKEPEHRVNVVRVRVHGKKLVVEGEVTNGGPFLRVPFRCDFSPSVSQGGHMLQCKDPRVYWGAPGGHIPLPMLPLQSPLNIDLGDRARIERLGFSGGCLTVGGRFILSPVAPLLVSQGNKRGNIQHDLAETLSRTICSFFHFRRE